jgi:hypothetical protein
MSTRSRHVSLLKKFNLKKKFIFDFYKIFENKIKKKFIKKLINF